MDYQRVSRMYNINESSYDDSLVVRDGRMQWILTLQLLGTDMWRMFELIS